MNSDVIVPISGYETYVTCKYRDLCLRFLGENPIQWAQSEVCPCPCTKAFFEQLTAYAAVLRNENEGSRLPYTRMQLVRFMTEREKRHIKKKRKEMPLSQTKVTSW